MSGGCPNCGGLLFVEDPVRGDTICEGCGACLPERIMDETLEKRNFSDSNKDHNRGAELDKYLSFAAQSTVIGKGTGNLQRAQNQLKPAAMSTSERNLEEGFANLRRFETMLSLQRSVVNRARDLMALFEKRKTAGGTRSEGFALAVIFAAMNHSGQGRSFKELAGMSGVDEKDIRSQYKKLAKTLPEQLAERITSASDFIRVIVSDLGAEGLLESLAMDLHNRAMNHLCTDACGKHQLEGKRPSSLAAGAILQAANLAGIPIKEDDVAGCAQIAQATAREHMRYVGQHMSAMYVDKPFEVVLSEMRAQAERVKANLGSRAAILAKTSDPIIKI